MKKITFNECPRPQMTRDNFELLDGEWGFAFDYDNKGEELGYFNGFNEYTKILVPYTYQCKKSGINIQKRCDNVWYQKKIIVSKTKQENIILYLEGADYLTKLYVNGNFVKEVEGAYSRHSINISDYVINGENLIVIKCEDDYSIEKPRGKQRWKDESFKCWYIDTTGIYKSVWIEKINVSHVEKIKITPLLKEKKVNLNVKTENALNLFLRVRVLFENELVNENISLLRNNDIDLSIDLSSLIKTWSLRGPNLYDIEVELINKNNEVVDKVKSYFGLRSIEARNGKIYLNNEELYQKLVLDQGYFDESHLTPTSNEELYNDIIKMMESGFNGARKHQKTEDERYFYYADILGFLTWVEMPSMYENTKKSQACFEREWLRIMEQYYNHPSTIVWTIFNESWGIEDISTNKDTQNFVNKMYYLTKEYDPYRLAITNDGWEHTISDIITLHTYEQNADKLYNQLENLDKFLEFKLGWNKKGVLIDGYEYQGQPIMIDEFGGAAYVAKVEGTSNWGYGNIKNDDEFIIRYKSLLKAIEKLPYCSGYCYTQVSDVQQEVNGLLDEKHQFKFDVKKLK